MLSLLLESVGGASEMQQRSVLNEFQRDCTGSHTSDDKECLAVLGNTPIKKKKMEVLKRKPDMVIEEAFLFLFLIKCYYFHHQLSIFFYH